MGFVLATAGSAVGLANVWAFPFRAGENGGAAFVVLYLLCIFFVCLPFMFGEIMLGRFSQKNVVGAIRALGVGRGWLVLGVLSIAASIFILSFYAVVAGWSFGYIFKSLVHDTRPFAAFTSQPTITLTLFLAFMLINVLVVYAGIENGIERWSKLLMPTLVILMLALIVYGLTLPGAHAGLAFFLKPDFSKITGKTVLTAMGQAFFSLSLGIGGILTYGSYLSKEENIVSS
ncbi:MAG: sodium-dependent transporter, partial [Calditrichaeota bacterium]